MVKDEDLDSTSSESDSKFDEQQEQHEQDQQQYYAQMQQPSQQTPPALQNDSHSVILVTAGYDNTIRFWEALSGICSRTIKHPDSVCLFVRRKREEQEISYESYSASESIMHITRQDSACCCRYRVSIVVTHANSGCADRASERREPFRATV